jgi:hypothetical protein
MLPGKVRVPVEENHRDALPKLRQPSRSTELSLLLLLWVQNPRVPAIARTTSANAMIAATAKAILCNGAMREIISSSQETGLKTFSEPLEITAQSSL